ncbi:MAG: metallophosphoesterase, partial [Succinivibrio sp.]
HINATTPRNEVDEIVTRVNSLNPDLIAITGDFADGKVESIEPIVSALFSLKSKYGVYAVSGNHELYWGYHEWLSFLEKGGISFLENRSVIISNEKGDRLINLCGITDKKSEKYNIEPPDVEKALKDTDSSLPVIALSHRPKYGLEFKNHAAVTLSGHTHGGMMPGIDLIVAIFNGGMVHDIYEAGNSRVIVSRGTGINMAGPVRILNKPQIAVVRLSNPKY